MNWQSAGSHKDESDIWRGGVALGSYGDAAAREFGAIDDARGWGRYTGRIYQGKGGKAMVVVVVYAPDAQYDVSNEERGKIGRVRILANLLAIHQLNTEELDDLFADVLSVERDLEELKDPMALIGDKKSSLGRQLIRIAVKVSVHLTKKKRKKILQEADKFWASPKDHGKTKALDESRQVRGIASVLVGKVEDADG